VNRPRRLDLAVPGRTLNEQVELARLAEQSGFEGAWISEVSGLDAVTQLAALGGALSRARIGTAIVPVQTRDPLLMAMTAASLSQLTNGRFVLGLGTSTKLIIEDWHSREWGKPLPLVREHVRLVRAFLAGERVTTECGPYRYKRAALGMRPEHPVPIYLGALGDGMLELAGEIADGVVLNFVSPEQVAHSRERIAAGAERAGRDPDGVELIVYFRTSITADFGEFRERYQKELLTYSMAPVYQRMFEREGHGEMCAKVEALWKAGEREAALAAQPDEFLRSRVLAGTPSEVQARLGDYFHAGMDTAIILPVPSPTRDYTVECARVIAALGPTPADHSAWLARRARQGAKHGARSSSRRLRDR
jgi:probable F420-dependent oxidoreductase